MPTIFAILQGTPLWVWGVLVYLVVIGLRATQPRALPWYRLVVGPAILTSLSIMSWWKKLSGLLLVLWSGAWVLGFVFGSLLLQHSNLSFDKKQKCIVVPGSWIPLMLSLAFFGCKYAFGVSYALYPELKLGSFVMMCDAVFSAMIAGISCGRCLFLYRFQQKLD